jgi:hypothetical protein
VTGRLSVLQAAALVYVRDHPGCTIQDVEVELGITNSHAVLGALFAKKLVGRQKSLLPNKPYTWWPEAVDEEPERSVQHLSSVLPALPELASRTIELEDKRDGVRRLRDGGSNGRHQPAGPAAAATAEDIDAFWETHPGLTRHEAESLLRSLRQKAAR